MILSELKISELNYLNSLHLGFNYTNLSTEDLEKLENILGDRLENSLTENYESTDESIILQNILDKLYD